MEVYIVPLEPGLQMKKGRRPFGSSGLGVSPSTAKRGRRMEGLRGGGEAQPWKEEMTASRGCGEGIAQGAACGFI